VANDDQNGMPRIGPERSPSGERDDVQHGPWTLGQRAAAQARADEPPGGPGRDEDQGRSDLRGTASSPNPYGPPDDLGSANPYGTIRYDPLGRYGATGEFPAVDPYGLYGSFPAYGGGSQNAPAGPQEAGPQEAESPQAPPVSSGAIGSPGSAESPGTASGSAGPQAPAESPASSGPPAPGSARASEERPAWGAPRDSEERSAQGAPRDSEERSAQGAPQGSEAPPRPEAARGSEERPGPEGPRGFEGPPGPEGPRGFEGPPGSEGPRGSDEQPPPGVPRETEEPPGPARPPEAAGPGHLGESPEPVRSSAAGSPDQAGSPGPAESPGQAGWPGQAGSPEVAGAAEGQAAAEALAAETSGPAASAEDPAFPDAAGSLGWPEPPEAVGPEFGRATTGSGFPADHEPDEPADPFQRAKSEPAEDRPAADPFRQPEEYAPADPYWQADPYGSETYGPPDPYGAPDPYGSGEYDPADPFGPADPYGQADPYEPEPYGAGPFGDPGSYQPAEAYSAASAPPRAPQRAPEPGGFAPPGASSPPEPPEAPASRVPAPAHGTGPGPADTPSPPAAAPGAPAPTAAPADPVPPDQARESAGGLTPEILLPGRRRAPAKGWRRVVYQASGGLMRVPSSAAELRRRDMINRVRTPVAGGHHRVAVLSLKGGVGKTTTTVGLGSTLASLRGDRVIAVDANPDRGTLSDKVRLETAATVRDLLNERGHIRRYADVRTFTSQAPSRLEVLASDRDPTVSVAFSEQDYCTVARVLEHYYSICLTDCGTGLLHSAMAGVLRMSDQIILVSSPSVDGARSASATLDWLAAHSYGDLVNNAVVVLSNVRPRSKSTVDLNRLEEHFAARCRAVIKIPYDAHLEEGAEVELDLLSRATTDAYLALAAEVGDGLAMPARARRVH
jgi:MinD-like ATPase involved in chromosome partitioning or flagellar assembly